MENGQRPITQPTTSMSIKFDLTACRDNPIAKRDGVRRHLTATHNTCCRLSRSLGKLSWKALMKLCRLCFGAITDALRETCANIDLGWPEGRLARVRSAATILCGLTVAGIQLLLLWWCIPGVAVGVATTRRAVATVAEALARLRENQTTIDFPIRTTLVNRCPANTTRPRQRVSPAAFCALALAPQMLSAPISTSSTAGTFEAALDLAREIAVSTVTIVILAWF